MKEFHLKVLLTLVLLAGLGSFADAAVVYLKDGSKLNGTIVNATAANIELFTEGGTLNIGTDKVLRIEYSETSTSQPSGPPTEVDRPVTMRGPGSMQVGTLPDVFALEIGLASPLTDVDFTSTGGGHARNGDTGILLGLHYLHAVTPQWEFGTGLEYSHRGPHDTLSLLPNSVTQTSGGTVSLLALAKYRFTNRGWIRPYTLFGAGPQHTSTLIDAQPQFGFVWSDTNSEEVRTLVDDDSWGMATTARIGLDFQPLADNFFSVELGWNNYYNSRNSVTPAGSDLGLESVTGHLGTLSFLGRWGWRF